MLLLFGWIKTPFLFLQFSWKLFHKFCLETNSELSFRTCSRVVLIFKYKNESGKHTPKILRFLVLFPHGQISIELMKNLIEYFIRKYIISEYKNLATLSFCHEQKQKVIPLQQNFNSENHYSGGIEWSVTIVAKCRDKLRQFCASLSLIN